MEPAFNGYLCYRIGMRNQHTGGMTDSDFIQGINKGITSTLFNKTAERYFSHTDHFAQVFQRDILLKMCIHILQYLVYPPAVMIQDLVIVQFFF